MPKGISFLPISPPEKTQQEKNSPQHCTFQAVIKMGKIRLPANSWTPTSLPWAHQAQLQMWKQLKVSHYRCFML